jgi:hypothetical protein
MDAPSKRSLPEALASGWRNLDWEKVLVLAVVNAAIAVAMWFDDPRPYWHPFVSVQCFGFTIAYCVRVAAPWDRPRAIRRLIAAVAIGSVLSMALVIVLKGYSYTYSIEHTTDLITTIIAGFVLGFIGSLIVLFGVREQCAKAKLRRAETALVAGSDACAEAIERIVRFTRAL